MSSSRFGLVCAFMAVAHPFAFAAEGRSTTTVHFHLQRDYLIVVPVSVNGAGPFDFLVDTGCSTTTIDPGIDRQLKLPEAGEATVALLSEVRRNRKVILNELRIGPVDMFSLPVLVDSLGDETALVPGVRGILGEDFLRRFDLLIDYDKRTLSFNEQPPEGERLPFESAGAYQGQHTFNRLMIEAVFPGAGGREAVLQLDTAAWVAELFPSSHISLSPTRSRANKGDSILGPGSSPQYVRADLRIGSEAFRRVTVALRHKDVASDAVGLLPTALFGNIYISHSAGFVILNPRPSRQQLRHNTLELAALAGN